MIKLIKQRMKSNHEKINTELIPINTEINTEKSNHERKNKKRGDDLKDGFSKN
jgi:hypothetical protein